MIDKRDAAVRDAIASDEAGKIFSLRFASTEEVAKRDADMWSPELRRFKHKMVKLAA